MQRSNLFCPCERSEIGEVPQGEGVKKDRNYGIFLSVPATSHKRCGSTKYHNAKGLIRLLNIDEYGINNHNLISTPQSRTARQLPYIVTQHRGAKDFLFCPSTLNYRNHIAPIAIRPFVEPQRLRLVPR